VHAFASSLVLKHIIIYFRTEAKLYEAYKGEWRKGNNGKRGWLGVDFFSFSLRAQTAAWGRLDSIVGADAISRSGHPRATRAFQHRQRPRRICWRTSPRSDEPAACSRAAGGPPVARVRPSGRRPSTDVQDRARARRGGLQVRRARLTRHGPASSAQLAVGHTTNARPNATTNYYGRAFLACALRSAASVQFGGGKTEVGTPR
jgi:hypothetical protein